MINNINKRQLISSLLMSLLAVIIAVIIASINFNLWTLVYTVLLVAPIVMSIKYFFNIWFVKISNINVDYKKRKTVILVMTFFYIFQNILYIFPFLLVILMNSYMPNILIFNKYMALAWYVSWTFVNLGVSYFYKEKGESTNG